MKSLKIIWAIPVFIISGLDCLVKKLQGKKCENIFS